MSRPARRQRCLRTDSYREKFGKSLFFQLTVLFYAHLYLFPFEMCCHDCGRVCVSIFALCVDSDHHGYKFHTNRDGSPPTFLFPVFTLTSFSERSVWNLSGSFSICRETFQLFDSVIALGMGPWRDPVLAKSPLPGI